MIEISTKNASLDLQRDAKITIKQKSPLFTILEKEDKQSYSYPFTLPISSNNNRIISNILEQEKEETLQAILRANGVRLLKADLRVTERTNKNYEVALQLNKKVDLFNRKLNTLFEELGTFFITNGNHYVDFLNYPYSELGFFPNPANIPQKFVVSGITYEFFVQDAQNGNIIIDTINADTGNNNAVASFVAINHIRIERVDPNLPFYAYAVEQRSVNNFFWFPLPLSLDGNRTLAVAHANTIDSLTDFRDKEYCFPYFVTNMGEANSVSINKFDNLYVKATNNITLPSLRITPFLEKFLSIAGWQLESDFLKNIEIETLFITNCYGIANPGWNTVQNLQIFYSDCLPDLSFAELIKELQNLLCLNVVYDHTQKKLKIKPIDSILSQKMAREYECTEFFSQKTAEKEGYTLKYNYEEYAAELEAETQPLSDLVIGNGSKEFISNFPFMPKWVKINNQTIPLFQGGLRVNSSLATFNKESLRFLNDNSWVKDGECKSFNFMDYATREAAYVTENYSLTWSGLYNTLWRKFLDLLDKSEVEREIIFTFSDLQGIDLTELIRLEYSNYYIKELEYTLTNNEQIRILAKVILIKTI